MIRHKELKYGDLVAIGSNYGFTFGIFIKSSKTLSYYPINPWSIQCLKDKASYINYIYGGNKESRILKIDSYQLRYLSCNSYDRSSTDSYEKMYLEMKKLLKL